MSNRVIHRLSFAKKIAMAVAASLAQSSSIQAQAPHMPKFEVASVKPVEVHDTRRAQALDFGLSMSPIFIHIPVRGTRVELRGRTLEQLIAAAFRIRTPQVAGPGWLSDKRFDIEAIIPADAPVEQANEMLQTLLQERFGLRAHRTTREQAGYVLTVGKGGPDLKVSPAVASGGAVPPGDERPAERIRKPGPAGSSHYEWKHCSMGLLAESLAGLLQSPVKDGTGLKEKYDVVLDILPPADPDDRDLQPRVFDAVKKLGLNLKADKVPVEILVVDSIENTPTVN